MKQVKMVPQNPFDFRIFHYKPSSYWGSSIYGHPQMRKENWGWQMPSFWWDFNGFQAS
jgi:hypothetical protein